MHPHQQQSQQSRYSAQSFATISDRTVWFSVDTRQQPAQLYHSLSSCMNAAKSATCSIVSSAVEVSTSLVTVTAK